MFPDLTGRPIADLLSLAGRAAVVTGGARGLGLSIARRLSEAGAQVMIGDLDGAASKAAADELGGPGPNRVVAARLDVTDAGSVIDVADRAVAAFGRIDIWVNNAGIYPSSPIIDMTDDEWDRVIEVNLRGVFLGCREAARRMTRDRRGGVVVNVSSVAGLAGRGPGVAHYVASKHGIVGITKQLAVELAASGIRVLAVAPTTIPTPGVREALASAADLQGREPETLDVEVMLTRLMGRAAQPDDVARVVLFCASDMSMFMTGSTLLVDGGELAR